MISQFVCWKKFHKIAATCINNQNSNSIYSVGRNIWFKLANVKYNFFNASQSTRCDGFCVPAAFALLAKTCSMSSWINSLMKCVTSQDTKLRLKFDSYFNLPMSLNFNLIICRKSCVSSKVYSKSAYNANSPPRFLSGSLAHNSQIKCCKYSGMLQSEACE